MSGVELVAASWTTAGDAAPGRGDELSPHSLRERIEAASRAGFRGFGLLHADLVIARDRYGYDEIRRMFDAHGLVHLELEYLLDWWTKGPRRAASDLVRRDLLAAAEALGARHIKAGPAIGDEPWDADRWGEEFAKLASEFGDVGARVSLEFLPMFNIRSLNDALAVVQAAGHPSGGVLIDLWHVARTATPFSEVAAVPRERIAGIELDDAYAKPVGSAWEDTIDHRRLCGEGDFDVPGFINAVRATGWDGPWGLEIISAEYRRRPIAEALNEACDTTLAQFALADAQLAVPTSPRLPQDTRQAR